MRASPKENVGFASLAEVTRGRGPLALVLVVGLGVSTPSVAAGPPAGDASNEEAGDAAATSPGPGASATETMGAPTGPAEGEADLEAAREIYERGVADYNAGRYEEAVLGWLEAYNALPTNYDTSKIRAELIYNIATAQKKAFDIDEDITHLRQARASLKNFEASSDDAYPEGPERDREREEVERVLSSLEEKIAEAEAARAEKEKELAALSRPAFDPELDARLQRQNRSLIIGGASLTALGVAGLGTMGAGFGLSLGAESSVGELSSEADVEARRDALSRGRVGNALTVVGALVGGVGVLAGASMLGVGLAREKQRKAANAEYESTAWRIGGHVGREGFGLQLRGRF